MGKAILLAAMIVLSVLSSSNVIADEIVVKPKDTNVWEMRNEEGDLVGILKGTENGSYTFYNDKEEYMGRVLPSGVLQPRQQWRKNTRVTQEEAQLYLDALKAIETINQEK